MRFQERSLGSTAPVDAVGARGRGLDGRIVGPLWQVGRYACRVSSVPSPPSSKVRLSDSDEARLVAAHARLRAAVAGYEPFVAAMPLTGAVAEVDAMEMRRAQSAVEAAERDLWALREELLGWKRPSWTPSAASMADWFSDEDAVYDDPSYDPARR